MKRWGNWLSMKNKLACLWPSQNSWNNRMGWTSWRLMAANSAKMKYSIIISSVEIEQHLPISNYRWWCLLHHSDWPCYIFLWAFVIYQSLLRYRQSRILLHAKMTAHILLVDRLMKSIRHYRFIIAHAPHSTYENASSFEPLKIGAEQSSINETINADRHDFAFDASLMTSDFSLFLAMVCLADFLGYQPIKKPLAEITWTIPYHWFRIL